VPCFIIEVIPDPELQEPSMTKVLYVTSSPRGEASYSNQVAARVLDEIRARDPACEIVSRELADDPLPHIDETFLIVARTPDGATNDHRKAVLARSDALVDELIGSDIVVIAAPMINLGIPSTLKAWIDQIVRAGQTTFSYTEAGVQGLVGGKKAIIVAARGGTYSGEKKALDFQLPYLESVLGLFGVTDITSFEVDGTSLGQEVASRAVAEASRKIRESFAQAR
jgi:FMN-dependent NADH-azoreductase